MKRKFSVISIIIVSLLILFIQPVGAVNVGGEPRSDLRTPTQSFTTNFSDYSMKGLFSTSEQTFWVASSWDVQNVLVHLEYRATPLADTQLSSMTVAINDTYFYSFRPADNTGGRHGVDIEVPLEFLKPGYNNIRIDGYMRTQDSLPCVDDVSEANWLDIFKESTVSVQYDKNAFTTSIESFYNRFYEVDALRYQESAFIISDSGNVAETNAALLGIAGISNQTIYDDGYFPLLSISDPSVSQIKNRIIMMVYDQLPENYRSTVDQTGLLNDQDALLTIINEGSDTNVLLITAKNDIALINAGRMLGNPELMNQLISNTKVLGRIENIETQVYEEETYIPFAGSQGTYYNGAFRQTKEFAVNYPANRSIADASEFYLNYRYSENLDFDRSLMTVYINDVPIGSRKLSMDKAGGDEATILIPNDIDISGSFQVKVTFDLEIKDLWCTLRQGEMPWAFLTPDTMLKINSVASRDLIFENYPAPFVTDYSLNDVTVVVPDKLDINAKSTLAKMFRVMGRYTKGNTGSLAVIHPGEMNEAAIASNIIGVGTFQNNSFIQNNNDKLFFKFNDEGTAFVSNEKLVLDPGYGSTLGSAQLLSSLFNKSGRATLIVAAPLDSELVSIGSNLGEMKNLSKLTGDGVLADYDGNLLSYRFKDTINPTIAVVKQIALREDAQIFILVSVMFLILLLVGLVFVIKKNGIQFKKGGWKK
ncbi:cellulose biosynthesis cyclic di-GMP-binding regulatory protein BcsB [Acetobacterium bakii]|uniref:Cellulose synthase n=1 Tax=Acetobacterium bakii TaxID=52689 RepID=A0A0L6U366_9FIRM|nr:cellulose biosynthesis cyclic di-GMP-binding regulatory protein BcsB [Acetobacterium bakii]KNZ42948.1 hypothetical protein AKG39_04305 [Acetobacterium bakii]